MARLRIAQAFAGACARTACSSRRLPPLPTPSVLAHSRPTPVSPDSAAADAARPRRLKPHCPQGPRVWGMAVRLPRVRCKKSTTAPPPRSAKRLERIEAEHVGRPVRRPLPALAGRAVAAAGAVRSVSPALAPDRLSRRCSVGAMNCGSTGPLLREAGAHIIARAPRAV